jgi:hypothetical protein
LDLKSFGNEVSYQVCFSVENLLAATLLRNADLEPITAECKCYWQCPIQATFDGCFKLTDLGGGKFEFKSDIGALV